MTFLTPFYFWTLLALLPLLGIYFLKVRPQRAQTTALFLWRRIYEEKRRTTLFRRLRDPVSLLLMAVTVAAIAMALAEPEMSSDDPVDLFLVVDHSVSMGAEQGESSLDEAKAKARALVRGLRGTQRAAILAVASDLRFECHLTDNPRVLLEAIREISPSTLPLKVAALAGVENLEASAHRVVLITDAVAKDEQVPSGVEVIRVGKARENVGIVAADLQVLPDSEQRLGLYFQLASSFEEPRKLDVIVRRASDGVIGKLVPVTVRPGMNEPEVYTLEDTPPGEWELELDLQDALAADNRAWLVAHDSAPVKVRVDAEDRYFLVKAVRAFEGRGDLVMVTEAPDVVLAMGAAPDAGRGLIFQPGGSSPWWQDLGDELEDVVPKIVVREHPVLRYVDVSSWGFEGARHLQVPDGALVLVESDLGVPLVYLAQVEGRMMVVVNMDPVASEFYFSAWFPVLVQSVAMHLSEREMARVSSYAAGDTLRLPGEEKGRALLEFGFHALTHPKRGLQVGVSMFQADETLLGSGHEAGSRVSAADLTFRGQLAGWFTLLAILVLVVESVLYHRRKVG